jgi:hypothetical protein
MNKKRNNNFGKFRKGVVCSSNGYPKPITEMTEEEIQREGSLRYPLLKLNKLEFIKNENDKNRLKKLKSLYNKKSIEIKTHDTEEIISVLKNSNPPQWDSIELKLLTKTK